MQTFLPVPDFDESARMLDSRRLGKQRPELVQALRALTVPGYGWRHHPVATMWAGYEEALVRYGLQICREWCGRGNADTVAVTLVNDLTGRTGIAAVRLQSELRAAGELPPWLGDPALHDSHQSALVRKDPAHYRPFFPDVADDLPYHWPASDRGRGVPL